MTDSAGLGNKTRPASSSQRLRRRLDDSLTRVRRRFASLRRRFSSNCSNGRTGAVRLHRSRRSESASSSVSVSGIAESTQTTSPSSCNDRTIGSYGCYGNNNDKSVEVDVSWSGQVYAPKTCLRNRSSKVAASGRQSAVPVTMALVIMPTLSRSSISGTGLQRNCPAYMPENALRNVTPLRRVWMPAVPFGCDGRTTSELIEVAVFAATTSEELNTAGGVCLLEADNKSEEKIFVGLEMVDQDTSSETSLSKEPEPEPPPPELPPPPPPPAPEPEAPICTTVAAGDRGGGGGGGGCCGCGKSSKVKRVSERTEPDRSEAEDTRASALEGLLADEENGVSSQQTLPPLVEEELTATAATVTTPTIDAADSEANSIQLVGTTPRPFTPTSSGTAAATSSGSTESIDEEIAVGIDSIEEPPAAHVETLQRQPRPYLTSNLNPPPSGIQRVTGRYTTIQVAQQQKQHQLLDSSSTNSEETCKPLMIAGVGFNSTSDSVNGSDSSSSWISHELELSVPARQESPKPQYQCSLTFTSTSTDENVVNLVSGVPRMARNSETSTSETESWSIEEVHAGGGNNSISQGAVSMQEWEVTALQQQQNICQMPSSQAQARTPVGYHCTYSTNTLPSDGTAERTADNSSFLWNRLRRLPRLQEQRWSSSTNSRDSSSGTVRKIDGHQQLEQQRGSRCVTIRAPVGAITDAALRKLDLSTAMRSCSLCPVDTLPPLVNNAAATASALTTVEREAVSSSRLESSIVFQLASRVLDYVSISGRSCSGRGGGSNDCQENEIDDIRDRPLLVVSDDMNSGSAKQQTLCLIQTPPLIMQARSVQCTLGDRLQRLQRSQRLRIHHYLLPESAAPIEQTTLCCGVESQLTDFATVSFQSGVCNESVFASVAACRIILEVVALLAIDWLQIGRALLFLAPITLRRDDTDTHHTATSATKAAAVFSGGGGGGSCVLRHGPLEPQMLLACDFIAGILEPTLSTKFALAAAAAPHPQVGQRNNWNASNNSADRSLNLCRRLLARLLHRSNSSSSSSSSSASNSMTPSSLRGVVSLMSRRLAEMEAQPCRSYCQAALHTSLLIFDSDSSSSGDSNRIADLENCNNSNIADSDTYESNALIYTGDEHDRRTTYFARRCVAKMEESTAVLIQEIPSRPAEATVVTTARSQRRAVERLARTRPELLWPPSIPGCERMLSVLDDTVASFIWWSLLPLRRHRDGRTSAKAKRIRSRSRRR